MITTQWLEQQFNGLSGMTPLAQGGQKYVFRAVHAADGDVVLKLIKQGQDIQRIEREIEAVQKVQSARVPRVLEIGMLDTPAGPFAWLREQRVVGEPVRTILNQGPMPLDEVKKLGLHVLEALVAAEAVRIVHRDVKPENIMRGDDGSYWLLDFGIARHLDLTSMTDTTALGGLGTVGYAPPEQYRNRKQEIDGRADLFALAVTMVECLTGKHPYRDGARDAGAVLRRIEQTPLAVPPVPGEDEFVDLISTMGQRRLDCRPPNAADALKWMREVLKAAQP